MSRIPPFWYPNRSAELSRQSFLINSLARLFDKKQKQFTTPVDKIGSLTEISKKNIIRSSFKNLFDKKNKQI